MTLMIRRVEANRDPLTDRFQDISLSQWLALTPPELVKAHLGFSDEIISHLSKEKQTLVK